MYFLFSCYDTSRDTMLSPCGQTEEDTWRLNYVPGDLFSCPEDESLAHCISEDCRMGAGIALIFRKKFNGVEELKQQSESDFLFTLSKVEISAEVLKDIFSCNQNVFNQGITTKRVKID